MKTQQQNPTATSTAVNVEEKINNKIYILYESIESLKTYSTDKGIDFKNEGYETITLYSDGIFIGYSEDIIFISSNLDEFNNYISERNFTNIMLNHE